MENSKNLHGSSPVKLDSVVFKEDEFEGKTSPQQRFDFPLLIATGGISIDQLQTKQSRVENTY